MKRRRAAVIIVALLLLLYVVLPGSLTLVAGWDFLQNIPRSSLAAVLTGIIPSSKVTARYPSPDGMHVVGIHRLIIEDCEDSVFLTKGWDGSLLGAEWLIAFWTTHRNVDIKATWVDSSHVRIEYTGTKEDDPNNECSRVWDGVTVECVRVED